MSDKPSFEDNPSADPSVSLARFAEATQTKFLPMAESWFRRFRMDPASIVPEGAVHKAWILLLQELRDGTIRPFSNQKEFEKIFTHLMKHIVVDE